MSDSGNPSKAFMCLEFGFIPVKFVIMSRRTQSLKYILEEPSDLIMKDVCSKLKEESSYGLLHGLTSEVLQKVWGNEKK